MTKPSCMMLVSALLFIPAGAHAADDHTQHVRKVEKPRIFWTTPVAVKFQLRRLSNAELLAVDRERKDKKYIPVYGAMLIRPGLLPKYRIEAVAALSALNASDPTTVLLSAIREAAGKKNTYGVLFELGHLLVDRSAKQLDAHRDALDALSAKNENPVVRRIGYGGRIAAGHDLDEIWAQAEQRDHLTALLGSLSLVRSTERRAAFWARIKPLLDDASDPALQAAAIEALGHVPGHDVEVFENLAAFISRGRRIGPAVRALSKTDRSKWPADRLGPLAASIVNMVAKTSPEQRTQPHVVDAIQLGNDVAAQLPAEQGAAIRKKLRSLGATVILLRTVRHEMRYDKKYFAVEAGRPVQIILENVDVMPHNVVIVRPGAIEIVGVAAETMQQRPGEDKPFVPDTDKVLFASRLVQTDRRERLSFAAPETPGEYPYVCTFPGHWRRMYGVMVVVDDLDAWLAHPTAPADPLGNTRKFVKDWAFDDLAPHLAALGSNCQFDRGKSIFTEAGCVVCHKINGEGGQVGPELTKVFERLKNDSRALLREILEPSAVVAEPYQVSLIETDNGELFVGLITAEDEASVSIVTNPQNPVPLRLDKKTIADRVKGKDSLMPVGTLSVFTREEILDLLAYVASGGNATHKPYVP